MNHKWTADAWPFGSGQSSRRRNLACSIRTRNGGRLVSALAMTGLILSSGFLATAITVGATSTPAVAAGIVPTLLVGNATGSSANPGFLTAFPLSASGNVAPSAVITPAAYHGPYGEAFDSVGDLWTASFYDNMIYEFTPDQLVASGSPTPKVALNLATLGSAGAEGLAFDSAGDLWVMGFTSGKLYEFTPGQLAASSSPQPAVTITSPGGPGYGAFDTSGDLWVSDFDANTLVEYTPGQLAATGAPAPAVTISTDGSGSISEPWGVAFDASDDLWLSNFGGDTLVKFTPSQLQSSGSPTPATVISSGLAGLTGIGIDSDGDLWATSFNDVVEEFSPEQLATTGSPTPADTISGAATQLDFGVGLVIEDGDRELHLRRADPPRRADGRERRSHPVQACQDVRRNAPQCRPAKAG